MLSRTRRVCHAAVAAWTFAWAPSCGGDDGQSSARQSAAEGGGGAPASAGATSAGSGATPAAGLRAAPAAGAPGEAGRAGTAPPSAGASGATSAPSSAAGSGGQPASSDCTRELLRSTIEVYYEALEAHDASKLPLATALKFTENGMTLEPGEGLWKTAGAAKFKRSALDTQTCSSVTESVVTEGSTDIVVGLRLKLALPDISEIESIVVRKGDYSSNPMTLLGTASDDWETVLPADHRPTRATLMMFVDRYFTNFPAGGCMFASDCKRYENGFTPGNCSLGLSCDESGMSRGTMKDRLSVLDVEAGIAVGFTMFQGQYTDFHMFKVRDGEVHGVHAVLAKASSSGW